MYKGGHHGLRPPASRGNPVTCFLRCPMVPNPHKVVSHGKATNEVHLTMDPPPCKYASGTTLGLQLRKSQCNVSLAICCNGSKGTRSIKPALKRAFPNTLINPFKLMASPNAARTACSSPLHASFMCKVTLLPVLCQSKEPAKPGQVVSARP